MTTIAPQFHPFRRDRAACARRSLSTERIAVGSKTGRLLRISKWTTYTRQAIDIAAYHHFERGTAADERGELRVAGFFDVVRARDRMQRIDERQFPDAGFRSSSERDSDDARRSGCAGRPSGNADAAPAARRDGATPTPSVGSNCSGGGGSRSSTSTSKPFACIASALESPAMPAPMMMTFVTRSAPAADQSARTRAGVLVVFARDVAARLRLRDNPTNCSAGIVGRPRGGRSSCTAGPGSSRSKSITLMSARLPTVSVPRSDNPYSAALSPHCFLMARSSDSLSPRRSRTQCVSMYVVLDASQIRLQCAPPSPRPTTVCVVAEHAEQRVLIASREIQRRQQQHRAAVVLQHQIVDARLRIDAVAARLHRNGRVEGRFVVDRLAEREDVFERLADDRDEWRR